MKYWLEGVCKGAADQGPKANLQRLYRHPFGVAGLALLLGCGQNSGTHWPTSSKPAHYHVSHASGPGPLFLIGGGDDSAPLLRHFIDLAGGGDAPLVIVPFAGGTVQGDIARAAFKDQGAKQITLLGGRVDQLQSEKSALAAATGIFFAGGSPDNLLDRFGPYMEVTKSAWQAGCAIGGTSAGAMVWGTRVILHGETPDALANGVGPRGLLMAPGLSLLGASIIDPHFGARARFNRLWTAAGAAQLLGFGIDEQTAALLPAVGPMEVSGTGAVTVIRPEAGTGSPARVAVVAAGHTLNLKDWRMDQAR
jgi:cyanophycinase